MDTKGGIYKTKWDVTKVFEYGEVVKCANWIAEEFRQFWSTTKEDYVKNNQDKTITDKE